jgi:hypothetical protein
MLRIDAGRVVGPGISTLLLNQKHSPRAQSAPAWMLPPWRVLGGQVICPWPREGVGSASRSKSAGSAAARRAPRIAGSAP